MTTPYPKFVGGDYELSTGGSMPDGTPLKPWHATKLVLAQIDAGFVSRNGRVWPRSLANDRLAGCGPADWGSPRSTDCLRHWASNGQSFYSDMAHVECCTSEALDARSYAAGSIAALMAAEAARRQAEATDAEGATLTLSTHNADWLDPSISSGTHFNVCITRALWDDLFHEVNRPAVLGAVASGVAAAIAFFGAGYLLPLSDGTTIYSLSARAHHLSKLVTFGTTQAFQRGILNSRDEAHSTVSARMHHIGFDLGPVGLALRCGFVQCLLAAAEQGFCAMNLFDPVRALRSWSWGLDLGLGRIVPTAALADGRQLTLPEYIGQLAGMLLAMVEQALIPESCVPGAVDLLPRIIELAERLQCGELQACSRHLDWAAKLLLLGELCRQPGVRLGDLQTRLADQDYGNTNPQRGWFWRLWEHGAVDPLISHQAAVDLLDDGPAESRGWARGRLIRQFPSEVIAGVNWGYVELQRSPDRWSPRFRLNMPQPGSFNRDEFEAVLAGATTVDDLERLLRRRSELVTDSDPTRQIEASLVNFET